MFSKLISAALVLAMIASPTLAAPPPRCTPGSPQVKDRKEWRMLTVTEKQAYFRGMDSVIRSGFYDELANTHSIHNNYIHGNPLFLPWHRAFTVVIETEMRKAAGEQFTLPYWDWGFDSQAPELAPFWGDDELSFGRGGDRNGCVTTGHFRSFKPKYGRRKGVCLNRGFEDTIDPVTSTDMLNRLMTSARSYDSFRRNLEGNPHASVHVNIGGDMGIMISPTDPVFFMHHAMVDKVWADWQKLRPENKRAYGGNQAGWKTFRGGPAAPEHVLYPYEDWKVADTFDTEVLCFRYADLKVSNIRVNNIPPPTVQAAAAVTQPSAPVTPPPSTIAAPAPVTRPSTSTTPPPSSNEDRKKKDKNDPTKKISKFFKDLFNEGGVDPSQAPVGEKGLKIDPAPVDSKVTLGYNEDAPGKDVDYKDRSELVKLRPSPPIPDEWLALNHLDVAEVRKYEADERKEIQKLNNIFGYISPSALWNQAEKVATLAKTTAKKFEATFSSVVVSVENSVEEAAKDALQAVSNLHARVKLSIGFTHVQNIEKVKPQVTKILGEEVYSKDSAGNPYRTRSIKA